MSRRGFIAYGVALAGFALLTVGGTIHSIMFMREHAGSVIGPAAIAGWTIASLGPIALSLLAWMLARRTRARWLPHLLFIPAALVAFRAGARLFFGSLGVTGDSMIEGFALIGGMFLLMLGLVVHLVAAVAIALIDASERLKRS